MNKLQISGNQVKVIKICYSSATCSKSNWDTAAMLKISSF